VKTFTISFEEKRYDEAEYAREIAELYHTDHREFTVRPDAVDIIPKLIWHYDEPFADSSAIPTYYVSKATAEHVKVALTGDAGDECFCGYHRYKAVKLAAYFDGLPGPVRRIIGRGIAPRLPNSIGVRTFRRRLRRFLDATALDPVERYVRWIGIFDDERKAALCSPEFLARFGGRSSVEILAQEYRECPAKDFVGCTSFVDMRRYLPDDLLVKTDIASMANSLEARSPFLDHKVVEFASRVPTNLKLRGMTSKYLLKRAFSDMLPRRIRTRSKMGFGVPIADWFRKELRGYLEDAILSPRAIQRGYFQPDNIRALVREHVDGKFDHGYRLWSLLMLELWHRAFIDSAEPPERPA
jgi:asparagine synthase (glutamine-hydrolysing)